MDSKGSKMDLLLCLREEMQTRSTYDKVFEKVWGASGGWAVIMCPCGVVNSVKYNLRAESPRDYADMLLSFKHFPNVVIYDFARGLVSHTNLREPVELPFRPNEGRLAPTTQENITMAKTGDLKVELPWLQSRKDPPDADGHPSTGSAEHYALYDTFHQFNTKDDRDDLRLIRLVPELCGWLNSQVAEQLFSGMRKNNYFLNLLSPASHIFLMRNILHHHNEHLNKRAMEELKKVSNEDIILDLNGKAVLATNKQKDMYKIHPPRRSLEGTTQCGPHCEDLTSPEGISACRASWTFEYHPSQKALLDYVLDQEKTGAELIIRTEKVKYA
ncbi:uncharacterized protein LOC143124790 [Alosa pseudoharengus]|uniref:uncharacterized protein LOC143124790 n=1 Tax=Alosa pseudoharengus TaxID=34774 RepID=UPI003F896B1D